MAGQRRFDFSQLDAETAQLDLMIDPAEVFELAVRQFANAVARAVDAGPWHPTEGIGQIPFGSGRRPFQITARNARASQIQLADLPQRQRLQLGVQHVTLRAADRHTDGRLFRHVPGHQNPGRIGSVFRRSVKVVDLVSASFVDLVRQGPFERLASQIDGEHPRRQATFPHDFGDRRRHRIDQGHQIARRMAAQMQGVATEDHRAAMAKGQENFEDREVETHRSGGKDAATFFRRENIEAPIEEGGGVAVFDRNPFGAAGRPGGINQVGERSGQRQLCAELGFFSEGGALLE